MNSVPDGLPRKPRRTGQPDPPCPRIPYAIVRGRRGGERLAEVSDVGYTLVRTHDVQSDILCLFSRVAKTLLNKGTLSCVSSDMLRSLSNGSLENP